MTDDSFRAQTCAALEKTAVGVSKPDRQWVCDRLHYVKGDFDDAQTYSALGKRLPELQKKLNAGPSALFYLATPPAFFAPIVRHLGAAGLAHEEPGRWRRVIVEKPFGRDLASAKALNGEILSVLSESQTYRIDHYLGKETVQNIMALRFANGLFSRYGIAITSTMFRSRWRKPWAWNTVAASMTRPARCATWCRTISFNCCR